MDRNIDDIILKTMHNNKFVNTKKGLTIKNYHIDTLHKYGINVDLYSTYQDIIFLINDFVNNCDDLTDEEYDELDTIANELQERQYYENTNK